MAGARAIVAVDGIDGSGKSTLAASLIAALANDGRPTVLLRVDDFRRRLDWGLPGKTEADLYYDEYYDLGELDRCLREFLAGADRVEIARYDAETERLSGTRGITFGAATLAVVEGVFVLRVPTVASDATVIYVQVAADEARRRVLRRDVSRGRAAAEVERRIDSRYVPGQARYHRELDPVARAAVIVENDPRAPRALRVDGRRIAAELVPALRAILPGFDRAYS